MRYIIITLLLCSFSTVHSQIIVKAILLDNKGIPIPYANVYNKNTYSGVITNTEGRFDMVCRPNDSIVISCIGYQGYKNTANQLHKDSIITLTDAIYNIGEIIVTPNDAEDILRKVHARIRRNYPKQPAIIKGVFKEYSVIENEYYGYLQCDVDILIKSIASYSRPKYETKVYDYKSFRHLDREQVELVNIKERFQHFWLYGYSFLWNFKEYQFNYLGYTFFNDSKLIKIKFSPKHLDKYVTQIEGTMYIDNDTYALVYLQYEMIPNEMDFILKYGRWQKTLKGEAKIMFVSYDDHYYPSYVIIKHTNSSVVSGWKIKPNNKDTVNIDFVFNFFTKDIEYKPKGFVADSLSLDKLRWNFKHKIVDQSKDYKSDFILETEAEKQLKKQYGK
jgi:hypothetical protein